MYHVQGHPSRLLSICQLAQRLNRKFDSFIVRWSALKDNRLSLLFQQPQSSHQDTAINSRKFCNTCRSIKWGFKVATINTIRQLLFIMSKGQAWPMLCITFLFCELCMAYALQTRHRRQLMSWHKLRLHRGVIQAGIGVSEDNLCFIHSSYNTDYP